MGTDNDQPVDSGPMTDEEVEAVLPASLRAAWRRCVAGQRPSIEYIRMAFALLAEEIKAWREAERELARTRLHCHWVSKAVNIAARGEADAVDWKVVKHDMDELLADLEGGDAA